MLFVCLARAYHQGRATLLTIMINVSLNYCCIATNCGLSEYSLCLIFLLFDTVHLLNLCKYHVRFHYVHCHSPMRGVNVHPVTTFQMPVNIT